MSRNKKKRKLRNAALFVLIGVALLLTNAVLFYRYSYHANGGASNYALAFALPVISFLNAAVEWRASNFIPLEWNDRALKSFNPLFARREFVWDELIDIRYRSPGGRIVLKFSDGRKVRLFPTNSFISYEDYEAVKELAEEKLRENARTS